MVGPIPVWAVAFVTLLIGFAFIGGVYIAKKQMRLEEQAVSIPKIQMLDLAFQSSPMGADVYLVGTNEYLGRTPFRHKVEYRDDRPTFVVFRLSGHQEITQEVTTTWPTLVELRPLAPPPKPATPVVAPPSSTPSTKSVKGRATRSERSSKGKSKPRSSDPFEEGGVLKTTGGIKSNPFR
jgi:hypothetical protein